MSDDEGRLLIDDNSDEPHSNSLPQGHKPFSQGRARLNSGSISNENIPTVHTGDKNEEGEIVEDDKLLVQSDGAANMRSPKRKLSVSHSHRNDLRAASISPSKMSNGLVENIEFEQKYSIHTNGPSQRKSTRDQSTCVDWQTDLTHVDSLMQLESGSKALVVMNVVCKVQPNTIYVTLEIQGKEFYGIITEGEPPNVSHYMKKRNAAKNLMQEEERERAGASTPTKKTSIGGGTPKESAKRGPRVDSRRKISRRNSENGEEDESEGEPAKKIHLREFDEKNDVHMCPHQECSYKYRILDQLEYHIAHAHTNKKKMTDETATQTSIINKFDKETNTDGLVPSPSKSAILNSFKSPTQFSDLSDDVAAPELEKEGSFLNESNSSSKRAASSMSMTNPALTPIKKTPQKQEEPGASSKQKNFPPSPSPIMNAMSHSASAPFLQGTLMQTPGPSLCSQPPRLLPSPFSFPFNQTPFPLTVPSPSAQPRSSSASALHQQQQPHKIHELRANDTSSQQHQSCTSSSDPTTQASSTNLPSSSSTAVQSPSSAGVNQQKQQGQGAQQIRLSNTAPSTSTPAQPFSVMTSPTGPMNAQMFHPQQLLMRQMQAVSNPNNMPPPFSMPMGAQSQADMAAQFMAAMKHYNPMFPK